MDFRKQYPLGVEVIGTFKDIPFQGTVRGWREEDECLTIEVIHPHKDLPVSTCAIYDTPLKYRIYTTALCVNVTESAIRIATEVVTFTQWDNCAKRIESANLKQFRHSLTFTGIARRAHDFIICEDSFSKTLEVKKGWRDAMKMELVPAQV